jgi:acyl-CoA synthetase (AMP-forming)/AMP-acid ligase II
LIQELIVPIVKGPIDLSTSTLDELAIASGEIGELVVAGDHVCRDYYKNESANAENKLVDERGTVWHRMGDTGYFDDEGRFWLVGRVHSTIFRDRQQVHPQLVEQIVKSVCGDVVQVAAIGYDHADLGEAVVVLVEIRQASVEIVEAVKSTIESGLLEMNQPCDRVVVTDAKLPVDPRHNSKIDYQKAKELIPKLSWPELP